MVDPWVVGAVAIAGGILLLFGGRLLRPTLVLAVISLGAWLGLDLAEGTRSQTLPGWFLAAGIPGVAWLIVTPILAGLLAALLVRFVLAVLIGGATGSVVLLIGVALAGRVEPGPSLTPPPSAMAAVDDGGGAGAPPKASAVGGGMADHLAMLAESHLQELGPVPDLTTVVPAGLRAWWSTETETVRPGTLDLVIAIAVVVGLCGFLTCLLLPDRAAIWATSIAGAWLLSAAGLAAWTRLMAEGAEPSPLLPLLVWAVLSGIGVLYQGRGDPRKVPAAT